MLLFEKINTGKVHEERLKWGTLWLDGRGKWAPVMHGASKHLNWTVGISNCAASTGPAQPNPLYW